MNTTFVPEKKKSPFSKTDLYTCHGIKKSQTTIYSIRTENL